MKVFLQNCFFIVLIEKGQKLTVPFSYKHAHFGVVKPKRQDNGHWRSKITFFELLLQSYRNELCSEILHIKLMD